MNIGFKDDDHGHDGCDKMFDAVTEELAINIVTIEMNTIKKIRAEDHH